MNPLLNFAEKRFSVLALLVFSGLLNFASLNNASEGTSGYGVYVSSMFDRMVSLLQLGVYAGTIFLIIARFKSVVRPALRDVFLWGLVATIIISFFWSDVPSISRKAGTNVLQTTLFGLYLASRYTLKEQVRIIAWALGIGAVITVMYTLAFRGGGIESGTHAGAWRGPLLHKNLLARLMLLPALSTLLVALNVRRYRYLVWTVCGICVGVIVLTTSKTALIIFLTLIVLLPFYRALRWSDNLAIPFFITLILIGGSLATWGVASWDNLLFSLGKDPTLSGRTEIWDAVIHQIWERPWLGYGYQGFWLEGGESEFVWRAIRYKVYHAHNGFLNLTVDLGFVGLFFFGFSILLTYFRAIKWVRSTKEPEDLWPIAYVTFLLMYNYTESTIVEPHSLFWILYVSATLSLKRLPMSNTRPVEQEVRQEGLVEST